jgi:hypothetical protein
MYQGQHRKTLKAIKKAQDDIDDHQCKMNGFMMEKKHLEGMIVACSVQLEQRNRACMINEKDCGKCAMLLQAPPSTSSCSVKTVCKKKRKIPKHSHSKKKKKSTKGKKRKSRSVASSLSTPSGFSSYDSAYSYPYGDSSYF